MSPRATANVLSVLRLIVSVAASLFIFFTTPSVLWFWCIVAIVLASLTESIDGRVARKDDNPNPAGKMLNEIGTMGLAIALPGAILFYLSLGHWVRHLSDTTLFRFVVWLICCAVFLGGTFVFNRAKKVLVPEKAERYEVVQAWFTAFIVVASVWVVFTHAWEAVYAEQVPSIWAAAFWAGVIAVLIAIAVISQDRLTERRTERDAGLYKGTRQYLFRKG